MCRCSCRNSLYLHMLMGAKPRVSECKEKLFALPSKSGFVKQIHRRKKAFCFKSES